MFTSETARVVAAKLPAMPVVRRVSQALAMLDAVLMPEGGLRYHSFAADWGGGGWALARMRNGMGDDYLVAFTPEGAFIEGAFIKGFAHESAMSPWTFRSPPPVARADRDRPGRVRRLPPRASVLDVGYPSP
ncbi:MAG TPA: hypothetical protein VF880_15395 [Actinomycetes bacterium]